MLGMPFAIWIGILLGLVMAGWACFSRLVVGLGLAVDADNEKNRRRHRFLPPASCASSDHDELPINSSIMKADLASVNRTAGNLIYTPGEMALSILLPVFPTEPRAFSQSFPARMPMGQFLFEYLYRRGVRHSFGVPGDFALPTFAWLENRASRASP